MTETKKGPSGQSIVLTTLSVHKTSNPCKTSGLPKRQLSFAFTPVRDFKGWDDVMRSWEGIFQNPSTPFVPLREMFSSKARMHLLFAANLLKG